MENKLVFARLTQILSVADILLSLCFIRFADTPESKLLACGFLFFLAMLGIGYAQGRRAVREKNLRQSGKGGSRQSTWPVAVTMLVTMFMTIVYALAALSGVIPNPF